MATDANIIKININDILPSNLQPRKFFDEESIKELALSIKTYGILNPLLVRKQNDKYEIIAGERRYRAAKMLGLTELPVIIKEVDDKQLQELALIENIQRNNLNPMEEAESYKEILTLSNITQEELSQKIGKTQSSISNKMRLLNLNEEVKTAILNGKISERHGRAILKLNKEEQSQILEEIINKKLSVKDTEEIINKKTSQENIKNVLNSIDLDNTTSNTFKDTIKEIKDKGEEMNNNIGMGNFFPQIDNQNMNNNNNNTNTIMFNNTPMETNNSNIVGNQFSTNTTTVPLAELNQEPTISTIPLQNETTIEPTSTDSDINLINNTNNPIPQQENLNNGIGLMNDKPLFTSNPVPSVENIPTMPLNELPTESITLESSTIPLNQVEESTLDKIKKFISSINDVKLNIKEYNNEKENCIIITIEK